MSGLEQSDNNGPSGTVLEPKRKTRKKKKRAPRYNVILWNDDDHTFDYVVIMLNMLFGYPPERGLQIAKEVHVYGKSIIFTSSLEKAEQKRDQILAFGPDPLMPTQSDGPLIATIQKVDEET